MARVNLGAPERVSGTPFVETIRIAIDPFDGRPVACWAEDGDREVLCQLPITAYEVIAKHRGDDAQAKLHFYWGRVKIEDGEKR